VAKLALIEREKKRARLAAKYAPKRTALKAVIDDASKSDEERYAARLELQQLPRNSNLLASVTLRRSRSSAWYVPQIRIGTQQEFAKSLFRGEIPGLTKASW